MGERARGLMVAIANQLQPKLNPRYVASIEERVFIEGPQRRIPDVWIQKVSDAGAMTVVADSDSDTALIVEVDDLEIVSLVWKSSIRTTSSSSLR